MSMIFTDLQNGVATLLSDSAFFAGPVATPVRADGAFESANAKPLETAKALQNDLNTVGISTLITKPEVASESAEGTTHAIASVSVIVVQNVTKNFGDDGTGSTAYATIEQAMALLVGQRITIWTPLLFNGLNQLEVNSEGLEAWELKLQTRTLIIEES